MEKMKNRILFFVIQTLVIHCAMASQPNGFQHVEQDVIQHGIVPYLDYSALKSLKLTCKSFNNSLHYHMLDADTVKNIPEQTCTAGLFYFSKNKI